MADDLKDFAAAVQSANDTTIWTDDGGAGAPTAIVDPGIVLDYPPTGQTTMRAWADWDDEEPDHDSRRWTDLLSWGSAFAGAAPVLFVVALIAVVLAAGGLIWTLHNRNADTASSSVITTGLPYAPVQISPSTPVAAPPPTLDGVYRIDQYPAQATFHGRTPPKPQNNAVKTVRWAFRSVCISGTCTAHAVKLDKKDPTQPDYSQGQNKVMSDDLVFQAGAWQDATPFVSHYDCGDGQSQDFTETWTFEPVVNGQTKGALSSTVTTDGCGHLGNVMRTPFSASREGDAPEWAPVPKNIPQITPVAPIPSLPLQTPDQPSEKLLADLADHGVTASDFSTGANGEWAAAQAVCDVRAKGTSADQVVTEIQSYSDLHLSAAQARWLVNVATSDLCPQYN